MDTALPAALLHPLARLGAAAARMAAPADVREGLERAGSMGEDETAALAARVDALAGLLRG